MKKTFPSPPHIKLYLHEEKVQPPDGFMQIRRGSVTFTYPDGTSSEPFTLDRCTRKANDAVVIVAYYYDDEACYVYLRSAIRPALSLHNYRPSGLPEELEIGNLWELPAGLVESTETLLVGVQRAAARELEEELGFSKAPEDMKLLGKRTFPAAGIAGERLFFFEVEVDPATQKEPTLDGGPFEYGGITMAVSLEDALDAIDGGYLPDAKTEMGILRLARRVGLM